MGGYIFVMLENASITLCEVLTDSSSCRLVVFPMLPCLPEGRTLQRTGAFDAAGNRH